MSTGTIESYDMVGRKEDVSDIITNISPTKTPFQTMIGTEGIHNIVHSWQEDSLASTGTDAAIEGADAPTATWAATVLRTGTTQIWTKTAKVSGTMDAVKTYGRDKELAYQIGLRMAELKRDLEFTLVGSAQASVTGDDSTARKTNSYQVQIAAASVYDASLHSGTAGGYGTVYASVTTATAAALTETNVLSMSQVLYSAGAEPSVLMVKPADALVVAGFVSSSGAENRTRFIGANDKKLVNVIDVYVSPFSSDGLKVILNRFQKTSDALIFEPGMWKRLVLRNWFRQTLAKTGDSTNVQILGEFGLKHRNYAASGVIMGLA